MDFAAAKADRVGLDVSRFLRHTSMMPVVFASKVWTCDGMIFSSTQILPVVTKFTRVCVIHEPAMWRRSLESVGLIALGRISEVRSSEWLLHFG